MHGDYELDKRCPGCLQRLQTGWHIFETLFLHPKADLLIGDLLPHVCTESYRLDKIDDLEGRHEFQLGDGEFVI